VDWRRNSQIIVVQAQVRGKNASFSRNGWVVEKSSLPFYGDGGFGERFSYRKSFNSATDLRLKSAGLSISRQRKYGSLQS